MEFAGTSDGDPGTLEAEGIGGDTEAGAGFGATLSDETTTGVSDFTPSLKPCLAPAVSGPATIASAATNAI